LRRVALGAEAHDDRERQHDHRKKQQEDWNGGNAEKRHGTIGTENRA
jgi:hypothetical protein